MHAWTVHAEPVASPATGETGSAPEEEPLRRRGAGPVLVREGFSWLALLFPTLWFLFNRMWLVALAHFAVFVLIGVLVPEAIAPWVLLALQILVGFHARDLRRWTLSRRGLRLVHVVLARTEEAALGRLLEERPEFVRGALA